MSQDFSLLKHYLQIITEENYIFHNCIGLQHQGEGQSEDQGLTSLEWNYIGLLISGKFYLEKLTIVTPIFSVKLLLQHPTSNHTTCFLYNKSCKMTIDTIYAICKKNCAILFLSEGCQISTNCDKFWPKDSKEPGQTYARSGAAPGF